MDYVRIRHPEEDSNPMLVAWGRKGLKYWYGLDGYSRFVDADGERYAVEPYPRPWHPLRKLSHAFECLKWCLVMRQTWRSRREQEIIRQLVP